MNSTWNWQQAVLGKIDREYREKFLHEDKAQARIFIAIAAIWVTGYIYVEYLALNNIGSRFYYLLALRLIFSSVSLWLFLKLPRINDLGKVDLAVLVWSTAAVVLVIISNLTLKEIVVNRINIGLAWILGCYLMPIRHLYKTVPALLVSIFSIYLLLAYQNMHIQQITTYVLLAKFVAILGMNVFGFAISLRLDSQRYHQYLIQKTLTEGQAQLKELATSDSLTGIFNRRSFLETAGTEFDRYQRYGETFSFAIVDVDNLKEINDTYGHPAGDHSLVLLADTITAQKRSSDTVGRLAGDEFGLILPGTNADISLEVLSRIKNALAETIVEAPNKQQFQVSFSAGVSSIQSADKSFDDLYRRADNSLLDAKNRGRNRVERS